MKIATFNINNINKRVANLLGWLREASANVACLQELKAGPSKKIAQAADPAIELIRHEATLAL
jgi:exodeoxyribonuclease-3